eukprot:348529_1
MVPENLLLSISISFELYKLLNISQSTEPLKLLLSSSIHVIDGGNVTPSDIVNKPCKLLKLFSPISNILKSIKLLNASQFPDQFLINFHINTLISLMVVMH